MKRPGFLQSVVVAAVLAIAGAAFVAAFLPFIGTVTVARLVVPGLALAYLLFLLSRSEERSGRLTTLALWGAMAIASWLFVSSFTVYLLIHAGAIWLVRSLYFYSGVLPALADMGLTGTSVVFALGTLFRTGSVFLATWTFFLMQALFVVIPATLVRARAADSPATPAGNDDFERSRRQAEAALKQLITQ